MPSIMEEYCIMLVCDKMDSTEMGFKVYILVLFSSGVFLS